MKLIAQGIAVCAFFATMACGPVQPGDSAAQEVQVHQEALTVVGVYKIKSVATSKYVAPFFNGVGYSLAPNATQATAYRFTAIKAADGRYNLCENGTSTSQLCAIPDGYIAVVTEKMNPSVKGNWAFTNVVGDVGEIETPATRGLWTAETLFNQPALTLLKRTGSTSQKWKLEAQ